MATTIRAPPNDPLIVVIGATGTGKSKLAVDLALRFNGEVINGDAMQMYKGLPIVTNKLPLAERQGIPHHLIDFIGLEEKPWTVKQFVIESQKTIQEIRRRGRLPVLVGGTHYYTHALLYKDATLAGGVDKERSQEDIADDKEEEADEEDESKKWPILNASTEDIYAKLQEVDPAMASRWHPKDRRKIQRSLEIWLKTERKASEVYAEQQITTQDSLLENEAASQTATNQGLRYPSILLWLEAEDTVLKDRLNRRVDQMVSDGLCKEALEMNQIRKDLEGADITVDESKGVWVSIGYKELQPWLNQIHDTSAKDSTTQRLLDECIESVKAGTRRYAKRQNRYIRIRLANDLKDIDALNQLFLLDSTNLDEWDSAVSAKGQQLVHTFLQGEILPDPRTLSDFASITFEAISQNSSKASDRVAQYCEVCDKYLMTDKEWQGHLASRSHKKVLQSQRKRLEDTRHVESNGTAIAEPP